MTRTTHSDKLLFTFLISIIIHLIILLGISFDIFHKPSNAPLHHLDIILVKQKERIQPEDTDFLAPANNESGGEKGTPSQELSPELPVTSLEESPGSVPLTVAEAENIIESPEQVPSKPKPDQPKPVKPEPKNLEPKLTQKKAEREVEKVERPEIKPEPEAKVTTKPIPKPSVKDLMLQARNEIHDLQNRLDQTTRVLSERPKKQRISASTKEFAAAAYMKAWEMKVEHIGNMNYPQEARQQGLNGSLILSVDIMPDGSVPADGIVISRSSGHKVLDEAAIRIVRLGAPYAVIPKNVLKDNDMLTIIRTWKFESDRGLSTR